MQKVRFKETDVIIRQGDRGDKFYVLESGTCDISVKGKGTVMKASRGVAFGELALMFNQPRAASVTAEGDVVAWQVTFAKIPIHSPHPLLCSPRPLSRPRPRPHHSPSPTPAPSLSPVAPRPTPHASLPLFRPRPMPHAPLPRSRPCTHSHPSQSAACSGHRLTQLHSSGSWSPKAARMAPHLSSRSRCHL